MKHYVTPETLKLLHYSLFNSFLSYGIVILGLTHPSIVDRLFKVRVIHTISFKDRYTHTTPLFYDLKILKLHDIHSLKLLCFVYECTNNSITPAFDNYFDQLQFVHSYSITLDKHLTEIIYTEQVSTLHSMGKDQPDMLGLFSGII